MTNELTIRKVENGYIIEYTYFYVLQKRIASSFEDVVKFLRVYFAEYKPQET